MSLVQLRSVSAEPSVPSVVPARVVLSTLVDPAIEAGPRAPGQPVRIGQGRAVPMTANDPSLGALLQWEPSATGGLVAAVTFRSEGAAGLRLGLAVNRLPAQVVLRVFGTAGRPVRLQGGEVLGSLARDAQAGTGTSALSSPLFWTPTVAGEEATLQLELPAGTSPAELGLAVPRLSHLWWTHAANLDPQRRAAAPGIDIGTCHIDATCESSYSYEARAVARMEYMRDGDPNYSYYCTGTLMADTAVSGTPYFLTATHCVGTQTEASTVSTYWFYRSAACQSTVPNPNAVEVQGGSTLLRVSSDSDLSFLQLSGRPPTGAVHAGSLVGQPALDVAVGALHHPGGELLKLSEGRVNAYGSCIGNFCQADEGSDGNYLVLRWTRGVTAQGSSGSPIFAQVGSRRYVVGHLFAGSSSCSDTTANDYFGRMDRAYPLLRSWLGTVPGT
jgi:lysyl endopeptidase